MAKSCGVGSMPNFFEKNIILPQPNQNLKKSGIILFLFSAQKANRQVFFQQKKALPTTAVPNENKMVKLFCIAIIQQANAIVNTYM